MATRFNCSLRVFLLVGIVLTGFCYAYGFEDPYKTVVKHIESDYNAKKSGIPFLGVANFIMKFWHPAGVKNVKVVLFDHQDLTPKAGSPDFDSVVTGSTSGGWHALARIYSRPKRQWTYIYYTDANKDMRILVASLQPDNAVVAQVRFDPEKLAQFVANPKLLGVKLADDIRTGPTQNGAGSAGTQPVVASNGSDGDDDDSSNGVPINSAESSSAGPLKKSEPPTLIRSDNYDPQFAESEGSVPPPRNPEPSEVHSEAAIKLKTTLINLNVQATDKSGRPVTGLTKEDFQVSEEGTPQSITYFSPETSPVSVLMLLDMSGSTKNKTKAMKAAAARFVEKLSPGDKVAVATFTRRFRLVTDFSPDHSEVIKRIKAIKNKTGGTAYYDAMWTGFDMASRVEGTRKAIIVLTDGVDNSLQDPDEYRPTHPFSELADRASEDEVTVYPIYMDTEHDKPAWIGKRTGMVYKEAREELQRLADDTAGTLYRASSEDDLKTVYERVAAELHTIYTLAYSPKDISNNGGFRKVSVSVKEEGVVTRTRKGYYAR